MLIERGYQTRQKTCLGCVCLHSRTEGHSTRHREPVAFPNHARLYPEPACALRSETLASPSLSHSNAFLEMPAALSAPRLVWIKVFISHDQSKPISDFQMLPDQKFSLQLICRLFSVTTLLQFPQPGFSISRSPVKIRFPVRPQPPPWPANSPLCPWLCPCRPHSCSP